MPGELATQMQAYMQPVVNVEDRQALPYVIFANKKSEKWDDMAAQIRGLQEPNPVLINNGTYEKLVPFKFHLMRAQQLWVERQQGREPVSVLRSRPTGRGAPQIEEIHAIVLVYAQDGVVPATTTFKRALCKGANVAASELKLVSDPATIGRWIDRSPEHQAAARIDLPPARFTVSLTTHMHPPKYGDNPYPQSEASCAPTTVADWAQLQAFFDNEYELFKQVEALYESRLEELLELEVTR